MIQIQLDGHKVCVPDGSTIMHAAEKVGVYIPHFCYHKKLSIAANCRMCLVDVEKSPKSMPACATPVTQGMIVRTNSDNAIKAQKGVMEFLLINHPLDCPICDQGGECQLQDLAVGYGGNGSRYGEEKRTVTHKDIGPLVSMQEMSRCIHCTRCVRFGQEIAGVMELGMPHRGEHTEIETFVGMSVDSELSGNMIDICPVGALTSKPFRYSARTWELSRRKSVSPHDSTGTNLVVQVKADKVMRVVPFENEDINECWIADRDRFSYESLNSSDRLSEPMIKRHGEWITVGWQDALEHVANKLKQVQTDHGSNSIGTLISPHSTLEELHLAALLTRDLGSDNIDYRLRTSDFTRPAGVRWLGTSIASLSNMQHVLIVGSNLRKEHPLFAQRIRQAVRKGCVLSALNSSVELTKADAWAIPINNLALVDSSGWVGFLSDLATAIAVEKKITPPVLGIATSKAQAIAKSLLTGERKAVLLGNAAAHHVNASSLLSLACWISEQSGASVGYLTEAANTVGAQLAMALPKGEGLNAGQMLNGSLKAVLLFNTEPEFDSTIGFDAHSVFNTSHMVVTFSPFKANMSFSDVLLPIAPFTETSGTFVNAEGRVQSFNAVVRPLGNTRPGWKVLRVLANLLGFPRIDSESSQGVRDQVRSIADGWALASQLSNMCDSSMVPVNNSSQAVPNVANAYQLDGLVRRATSLQLTTDARSIVNTAVVQAMQASA